MSWPDPRPGLVIRYSYLWRREHDAGREEGVKDRPCAIVVAITGEDGDKTIYVLPITHTRPANAADACPGYEPVEEAEPDEKRPAPVSN